MKFPLFQWCNLFIYLFFEDPKFLNRHMTCVCCERIFSLPNLQSLLSETGSKKSTTSKLPPEIYKNFLTDLYICTACLIIVIVCIIGSIKRGR